MLVPWESYRYSYQRVCCLAQIMDRALSLFLRFFVGTKYVIASIHTQNGDYPPLDMNREFQIDSKGFHFQWIDFILDESLWSNSKFAVYVSWREIDASGQPLRIEFIPPPEVLFFQAEYHPISPWSPCFLLTLKPLHPSASEKTSHACE